MMVNLECRMRWISVFSIYLVFMPCDGQVASFQQPLLQRKPYRTAQSMAMEQDTIKPERAFDAESLPSFVGNSRRDVLKATPFIASIFLGAFHVDSALAAATVSVDPLLDELKQARAQMDPIPDLIKKEQWDSVRAILIKPPLSDLWTKSARKQPLLKQYADAVGDLPNGDEFAALEAKDEVQSHLRYLDMAVYNNVFNPIRTEGTSGATKELIRSYYEDPINEYKSSVKFIDELIKLGKPE